VIRLRRRPPRAEEPGTVATDEEAMRRCFDVAFESARRGGYPIAAVVTRRGRIVAEAVNRVSHDRDVTRHAEIVALAEAQKALGTTSLDDCALFSNVEPCALCAYAAREARVGKVAFSLSSPVMGGYSRWNILGDERLSSAMPDVFAPPPVILPHFLSHEADRAMREASLVFWTGARSRGLLRLGTPPKGAEPEPRVRLAVAVRAKAMRVLRRRVFDRFGRGG
jgi:tRNA(adenine34) deaminase